MNRLFTPIGLAFILLACQNADKKQPMAELAKNDTIMLAASSTRTAPTDSAARVKNWQAYMKPGKEHQMMAAWAGNWMGDVTMWEQPNGPAIKNASQATYKMIMGGRYLVAQHKGSYNGVPFEGTATWAFDNAKRVFICTWIDNMGTGLMTLTGTWDGGNKSTELKGKMVDPETGDDINVREVYRVIDNDRHIMQMFVQTPDGKEFKNMEAIYTRRK